MKTKQEQLIKNKQKNNVDLEEIKRF